MTLTHLIHGLILFTLVVVLLVLVVGGILHQLSQRMPTQSDIEPDDLKD